MEPSAVERVELALARLRAAGLVEAVCAADGRVRFRRVAYDASVDAQLDRLISMPIPAQE
jgi:hypothetical protein